MTNDVVSALQTFLKTFSDIGLTKKVGENVAKAIAQVKAVCERLSEDNHLPQESPTFVLQGLTKFSVPEFNGPFTLILNQERVNQMGTAVCLANTSAATLTRVLVIVILANNSYHLLNNLNAWNIPQGKRGHHASQFTPKCFNCGEPHLLPGSKRPRDESKIARNKKAYMDKRPKGHSWNNGRQKRSKDGKGGGNQESSAASGVQMKGNKWMCFFKRKTSQCNTTHTSGLHAAWVKYKTTFILPSTN